MAVVRPHVRRATLLTPRADRHDERARARARVVRRHSAEPGSGSDATRRRRRDLSRIELEQRVRVRCAHGRFAVALRPEGAARVGRERVLRCGEPRRGRVARQGLRRHARRPARRARCFQRARTLERRYDRQIEALLDHGRRAHRERQSADRQFRRRIRRARLRHRVRRGDRQARVALLHRAGQSGRRLRERSDGHGREDVARRVVEARRRRHAVGCDGLRPRKRTPLYRHGQRQPVEPGAAQPRRRRQPVSRVDRRARSRHRRISLALPDRARRNVGLHRDAADHRRESDFRRHDCGACSCRRRRTASSTCSTRRPAS